ncbi:hypothetical protein [Clostridium sp. AF17-21AC]|nr:hypothetical protein [Clostridium sp. AF17-21AC]
MPAWIRVRDAGGSLSAISIVPKARMIVSRIYITLCVDIEKV